MIPFTMLTTTIGIIILLVILYSISFVRVPVDKAAVITGFGKSRVLIGKNGFRVPFFSTVCYVSLEAIPLAIEVDALAKGDINVKLTGTAVVKIASDRDSVIEATQRFCNDGAKKTLEKISQVTESVVTGSLRSVAAGLTPEEINGERAKFEVSVANNIIEDLRKQGLTLDSVTLSDISTPDGYFANKTEPKMAESKSAADIAKAERQRDANIKTSAANQESAKAQSEAEALIALANKDKQVKIENYRAEQENAKIEANKAIEMKNIELAQVQATRAEQELIATQIKPAEANRKQAEIEADARKIAAIKQAEAEAEAVKAKAKAEADAIRLKGQAEADAVRAKAIAEAEGLEKKAEAFAKYNDAAKLDLLVPLFNAMAQAQADALSGIDKVTIVGNGDDVGGYSDNVARNLASSMQLINDLTGVDPKGLITKDFRKDINVSMSNADGHPDADIIDAQTKE